MRGPGKSLAGWKVPHHRPNGLSGEMALPNGNRAGPVAPARRALRSPADPPVPSRHDAGPPAPRGRREYPRPADGCRRWVASAAGPDRSTGCTPTRWPAPRSPTIDHDPSHRRHRGPAAGQSAGASSGPSRARTPGRALGPRMSRRRYRGPASRSDPPAVATATGAHGRAVSRGGDGRPSAASGPETARGDAPCRRCPGEQTRRQATRSDLSFGDHQAIRWSASARLQRPTMRGLSSSSTSRAKTQSLSEIAARIVTADP